MTRKEFLSFMGVGATFALTATCLGACKKTNPIDLGNVDFTLDLSDAANAALMTNGNYIIQNQVVVARGTDGNYYAATVWCSHEDKSDIIYQKSTNEFFCTAHDARFDLSGNGLNSKGSKGLTIYQTALNGTSLRIFS